MKDYWQECINLAKKAASKEEVPVGAIIVKNAKIIAKSYNKREKNHDILGHAEILAIKKASKRLKTWKLDNCELYVTLKPCSMCEEIIKQSRLQKVHFLVEKPTNKHEYAKTAFIKEENEDLSTIYMQILSDFFKKMR